MMSRENVHPLDTANFVSKVMLWWIVDLLKQGYKQPLEDENMFPLHEENQAEYNAKRMEREWKKEVKLAKQEKKCPKLWKAMMRFYTWKEYGFLILLNVVYLFAGMIGWYCILNLSLLVGSNSVKFSGLRGECFVYLYGFLIGILVECITVGHYNRYTPILGIRVRAGILALIYDKVLKKSKLSVTPGQVMELVCNDTQRFITVFELFIPYTIRRAIQGFLFIGWLFLIFGWKILPAVLLIFLMALFRLLTTHVDVKYRRNASQLAERRLGYLREVLATISFLKQNCLETIYEEKIRETRWQEIKQKTKRLIILSLNFTITICGQHITTLVTVLVLLFTDPTMLTFANVFPVVFLTAYIIFIWCLEIPATIHFSTDVIGAINRIGRFLHDGSGLPMLDSRSYSSDLSTRQNEANYFSKKSDHFLTLKNVSCFLPQSGSLSSDVKPVQLLKDVSVDVNKPGLVVVFGPVGSGKSSFLASILNELCINNGSITHSGNIAYVSDMPWVFPGTVRENILFGLPYNEERYRKTVEACQLEKDIKNFPREDMSHIGEHGATLSGGQRTRIALARAVYSRADIYLLDDPLSSLDSKVGERIFKDCIKGLLSDRIVLLTTHAHRNVREADYIVQLDAGEVVFQGNYDDGKGQTLDVEQTLKDIENDVEDEKDEKMDNNAARGEQLRVVEEDREVGNLSWKVYWKFFISGAPVILLLVLFFIVVTGQGSSVLLQIQVSELSKTANDASSNGNLHRSLTIYSVTFLVTLTLILIGEFCLFFLPLHASYNIHHKMVSSVLKASTSFFAVNPVGRILNRFSQDINNLDELLPFTMAYTIYSGAPFIAAIVLCCIANNYLIPVSTIALLVMIFLTMFIFGSD